jgi:hypothetical protein
MANAQLTETALAIREQFSAPDIQKKAGETDPTSGIFRFIDASSCLIGTRNQRGPEASCFSVLDEWSFYGADPSTHVRLW